MIEGEEIFESAQETGYRLCRARESVQTSGEESEELVFSAIWDLNVPNRLHVCLQNGQLKVFNVEDNTSERYNVMFRRYTPVFETNNQTEKRVEFHWDKMTTIPDRPNEIIFLLGISRTLMYTALPPPENNPYPEMPLLASTARGDFPGFIFGSPVMEISSHQSRITSMTVSPAGHILASGDESGNVRLLLLRLLDEISVFKQNERRRKKHTSSTIFSQFLPTYNVIIPAHDGPVYSMQWLPIFCSNRSNNVRNYALVTGSVDRSVRIWRVSCSSSTGISMTPAMVLDTLSTHVLSLNAFLYTDRYALAKINRVETFSNRATRSLSRASSFSSVFTFGGPDTDTEADQTQQVNNENAAKSIFLAAGTSVGTIYVWKLSYPDVHNAISPASVGDGEGDVKVDTTVAQPRTIVSDDGTKLYSLLQTSDRPIIHVALTAYPTVSLPLSPGLSPAGKSAQEGSGGDIVLAASDTQGVVHLYTPEKVTVHENTRDGSAFIEKRQQGRQLLELPHHPLYDEYRSKMSPTAVAAQAVAPLVRIGEQRYQSAVVACSFPPAYPNDDLPSSPLNSPLYSPLNSPSSSKAQSAAPPNQQQQQLSRWDPTAMVQRNGPLLVGIASGELNTYDSADLTSLSAGLTYEADHQAEAGFTLDSLDHRTGSAADRSDDPSVVSTDSDINASDRKALSRKSSMREKQTASAALLAAASAGDATSDSDSKDDGWETLQVSQKTVRYAPTIGGNVAAGTGEQTAARGRRSGKLATSSTFALEEEEEEECSEYPRTRPPPAPLPAVPKLAVRVPRPRQGSSSKDTATAVAAAHQSSQNQNYGRTRTRDGDDDNESATTMSVVTDTTSVASTPLPSPPQFLKNRMDSIASAQNANSHRVNPLAVPVQTFSKVLEGQVRALATKLDNDEISVSTQVTTRSDQLAAAGAAQAAVMRPQRYAGLTPMQYLDSADLDMLLAETRPGDRLHPKRHKQVDPEWLSHRKYGGPSAEDMSPIDLQDPLVALRLACYAPQVHGATARGFGISNTNASLSSTLRPPADDASCRTEGRAASRAMQEYRYNSEFGLRASANPDTLQQHFRNDINMNQIFGIFDANSANHLGEQAGDRFARDELLYLAGSSSCASVF